MAQWGMSRIFKHEGGEICVKAHVETGDNPFAKIELHSNVDDLMLMGLIGDQVKGGMLFNKLRAEWIGRIYRDWLTEHEHQTSEEKMTAQTVMKSMSDYDPKEAQKIHDAVDKMLREGRHDGLAVLAGMIAIISTYVCNSSTSEDDVRQRHYEIMNVMRTQMMMDWPHVEAARGKKN